MTDYEPRSHKLMRQLGAELVDHLEEQAEEGDDE